MALIPRASTGGGASLGDLYSKCVQMVNENKISTKNAWELPLIDHMGDIVDSFMGGPKAKSSGSKSPSKRQSRASTSSQKPEEVEENRFHEASCTIEASARIYACRVDCVHTDTYRVLGGLNSADIGEEDGAEGEGGAARKRRRIVGVNTLERNEANIVQSTIDSDEQSDPSFRRMAAAFDAGGAKGLLLSHLPVAEDLSLVFNGDVPLNRAQAEAVSLFKDPKSYSVECFGFGDTRAARSKISEAQVCSEIDHFRQQLFDGALVPKASLPGRIEAIFGALQADGNLSLPAPGDEHAGAASMDDNDMGPPGMDFDMPPPSDAFPDDTSFAASPSVAPGPPGPGPVGGAHLRPAHSGLSLPLTDSGRDIVALQPTLRGDEDVIVFDQLFQKFCGAGSSHQFAYFDDSYSKSRKDKGKEKAKEDVKDEGGVLVPADTAAPAPKERGTKRPLFDITGLTQPLKPIETEAVHKHQLSERAAQWQLHKDVPPYMIDRITMPSWPTWSKCDFACLGLRPHLMLKLVKKQPPSTEGPHNFTDLFSTVIVENKEAYPWLAAEARAAASAWRRDEEDGRRGDVGADDEEDFSGQGGLPAHLDIDPQELFLAPGEQVLAGAAGAMDRGGGHGGGGGAGDGGFGGDFGDMGDFDDLGDLGEMGEDAAPFAPDLDLDLVDRPATVGDTDIAYSRNSKFVDVKLVKKHLLDCIAEDLEDAKELEKQQSDSSFQDLVGRTIRRLPRAETPNLSVAVCFICALHLCNEKSLELKPDPQRPLGDFAVVGTAGE